MMGESRDRREFPGLDREGKRLNLIRRMKRQRREIEQFQRDVAYWNQHVRKSDDAPIDWDPDGELSRVLQQTDQALQALVDLGPQEG